MADGDRRQEAQEGRREETKDEAYVVGPGRPPKHSQFKPRTSGNPKGRPKGTFSIAALIQKESLTKVPVTEGGRKKFMNKAQVAVRQVMNGAMKGDPKATVLLFQELNKIANVQSKNTPESSGSRSGPCGHAADCRAGAEGRRGAGSGAQGR